MPDHMPRLVDYLNRAFDELATATSGDVSTVQLRLGTYLGAAYSLRNYRKGQLAKATGAKDTSERLVRNGHLADGQHVEADLVARGNQDHSMTKMELPAPAPIHPSESLFPSDDLYPGQNLIWLRLDEFDEPTRRDVQKNDKDGYFATWLAGRPVLPAADAARECLINWEGFGRLDDLTYRQDLRRWAGFTAQTT
jgi:hypothetical protein